jgi:hypothetical protein
MGRTWAAALGVMVLLCAAGGAALAEAPYNVAWARQIGTSTYFDEGQSVAADGAGGIYITGGTGGSLGGPRAGSWDAFLFKYNDSGVLQWSRQIGTTGEDQSYSVAADGAGGVYISGFTQGSLGGTNAGAYDAFLCKYDASGVLQWSRQIGTPSTDYSYSVAADGAGGVYISGKTYGSLGGPSAGGEDAFLVKYDASGALRWSRQIGTSHKDRCRSVAADGTGGIYISGATGGSLGGPSAGWDDAFLVKYDASGVLQWSRQIGTSSDDYSYSVAADGAGGVYICGTTDGSLGGPNAGDDDAFLVKYDASGVLQWSRQIGTSDHDGSRSVVADGAGGIYITGGTDGSLGGPNAGGEDAFLVKYDASGALQWSRQIGTSSLDVSYSVAADAAGGVYITGLTGGSLGGPHAGGGDAFLVKYEVPEPATLALVALGGLALLRPRPRK